MAIRHVQSPMGTGTDVCMTVDGIGRCRLEQFYGAIARFIEIFRVNWGKPLYTGFILEKIHGIAVATLSRWRLYGGSYI
jgi:hypothetical protein